MPQDARGSPPSCSCRRHPSCCKRRPLSSCTLCSGGSLERTPTGRSRLMAAKSCQLVDHFSPQALAALTALLCQPPQGDQRTGVPTGGPQCARELEEATLLHLCVVEVAEYALQPLERAQNAIEIGRIVECRRDIDQVP